MGAKPVLTPFIRDGQVVNPAQEAIEHFKSCEALFQSPDADIILECAPHHPDATSIKYAFPAHREMLAKTCVFFADMLEMPSGQEDAEEAGLLPSVRLEEDWQVVYVLLGYVYGRSEVLDASFGDTYDKFTLQLYNAAHKYQSQAMISIISQFLR